MIREAWEEAYPESIVFANPSYDTALVGCTEDGRAVYDFDKMVAWLMTTEGMEEIEAIEFIEYNTLRALEYMADEPIIINLFDEVL